MRKGAQLNERSEIAATSASRNRFGPLLLIGGLVLIHLAACGSVSTVPNDEELVGLRFEDAVRVGRASFEVVPISANLSEYRRQRSDGCTFNYGVESDTDIIKYWRIDPSPEECRVLKRPINM